MADEKLSTIGQVALNVRDLERAVAFYRDVLGMRFLFQAPPQMAFFDCGGIRLLLGVPETADAPLSSSIIYFKVVDLQAQHQAYVKKGVKFVESPRLIAPMPTHDLWMAFFHDSEGNTLALMSEVAKS